MGTKPIPGRVTASTTASASIVVRSAILHKPYAARLRPCSVTSQSRAARPCETGLRLVREEGMQVP